MTVAQSSTGGGDCSASRLTAARDRLARKQQEINDLREKIGPLAAEQYRTGAVDPSVQLFLSRDPDEYLDKGRGHRPYQRPTGSRTAGTGEQAAGNRQERADAADRLKALTEARAKAQEKKDEVQAKLTNARKLLNSLTGAQRAQMEAAQEREDAAAGVSVSAST